MISLIDIAISLDHRRLSIPEKPVISHFFDCCDRGLTRTTHSDDPGRERNPSRRRATVCASPWNRGRVWHCGDVLPGRRGSPGGKRPSAITTSLANSVGHCEDGSPQHCQHDPERQLHLAHVRLDGVMFDLLLQQGRDILTVQRTRKGWHIPTLLHDPAAPEQQHPKVVQGLLRHAAYSITMNVYDETMSEEKRNAHRGVIQQLNRSVTRSAPKPAIPQVVDRVGVPDGI
jgi:hypothetical protein